MTQMSIISSCVPSDVGHKIPYFLKDIFVLCCLEPDDLSFFYMLRGKTVIYKPQSESLDKLWD